MPSNSYRVLNEADVELNERNRIKIQLSEKVASDPPKVVLSLNKQWLDQEGKWQWGKGFQVPEEQSIELLQRVAEVLGLEVRFSLDDS
ncbi:hypothetical protein M0R72_16620 [Candidatus Pacearchaeota archaeon]|jgi:ribosomal protein L13E|nr:hypothetical protein [Candidatus Pacearchaeota archaeon]